MAVTIHKYYVNNLLVATVTPGHSHSRAWHMMMNARTK